MPPTLTLAQATVGSNVPLIVTDVFDMGTRGIKTITAIEVGSMSEGTEVAVDYKYEKKQAFSTSTYKAVYRNGIVFPMVSGVEFRVRVKATSRADFDVSYLGIRWKINDKRAVRGLHPGATRGTNAADD